MVNTLLKRVITPKKTGIAYLNQPYRLYSRLSYAVASAGFPRHPINRKLKCTNNRLTLWSNMASITITSNILTITSASAVLVISFVNCLPLAELQRHLVVSSHS